MASRQITYPMPNRRRMRAEVLKHAVLTEQGLSQAVSAETRGMQGFGLCLRMTVQDHAMAAFAAARVYYLGDDA
ncbi:hypothetical protein PY254_10515 [Rhodanobacter sp. AS-Z3]|uniref:hypothetical protein n=1 Tax=Rhodanobacter sp. AS-Z3 TaxID=3031330 RepID=UPI0024799422|nr:hypothetical protein [Rhodanobacter sp. AS-Z3]WEN13679.1 hypothetical protein PY254_10515 [Rhodanobacter sp. AS-Z3]